MDDMTSNAVTHSQKRKASASSPATSSPPSYNSRISIGNSWGDNRTLPICCEMERRPAEMSWMSCTDDSCKIHKIEKEGAGYWPKGPKVRNQSKKTKRKEQDRTSTSNTALEEGQASLPDIPYLSESLPPFYINDMILAIPPMALLALSLLYNQAGYNSDKATNANQFLSTLHSRLMGILAQRVREAVQTDALSTRVKQTDNKLHYSIRDGLLLAQTTNGYKNLYVLVGPLEKGVSLQDFILKTVHEGLGHFSAYKCNSSAACFFWWPQMRQDFLLYCRSCDKYQISNEPTTLPYGRSLTLPEQDQAYQSLAIDFACPFNESDGYTSIVVIMDRFTSYTYLMPLKDAAPSEKIFKKLKSTIFDVHGLDQSIVLDPDSRFTSMFSSQMRKSLGIQVWMATQYHHQTNGQVEGRIRTLKQLMRNFVNPRQHNWSSALPAIAAAVNGAPHESLGISPYHTLYGRPWKIFSPVQRSASKVPPVDDILNAHEATRMEVDMARKHATFCLTVQADKRCKPLTEPFKNGSRVLIRGRPYTSSPGRSNKLEPRWFRPFKVLEHLPDTANYKLHLLPRMARQKPYFHVSSLKKYRENDPYRFKSCRIDKPAPILIDNAEEWEAEQILDYRHQNNRPEFLVH